MFQVFFVDYGVTEELSLDKCREIESQFIHLPCQVVFNSLFKFTFIDVEFILKYTKVKNPKHVI